MNKKDNPHQCDSVYMPTEKIRYQCMLPEGHEEDHHVWFVTWTDEYEGDFLQ